MSEERQEDVISIITGKKKILPVINELWDSETKGKLVDSSMSQSFFYEGEKQS